MEHRDCNRRFCRGGGSTVPIPKGFYYVGGNLDTGVIISDNQEDEYDGETDKTTWEYTTSLKGNQFVWIPCTEENYVKCEIWNGKTYQITEWDKTTYSAELTQIRKYEGFYVARYESGLANSISEFTSTQFDNNNTNKVYNVEGIPQSKAGIVPWNFIDWNHSQANAKNMYNTESVSSGLITGTQWDVILNTMIGKNKSDGTELKIADITSPENWGNYMNNSIEYTGRMARGWFDLSKGWYLAAFGGKTTSKTTSYESNNGDLLTTGASRVTEVYHIYDVAGNLWEWTEEVAIYGTQYRIIRGNSCADLFTRSACYRNLRSSYWNKYVWWLSRKFIHQVKICLCQNGTSKFFI